jgi:hypothetical protein
MKKLVLISEIDWNIWVFGAGLIINDRESSELVISSGIALMIGPLFLGFGLMKGEMDDPEENRPIKR